MTRNSNRLLHVSFQFDVHPLPVGRLATRAGRIYFEYDPSFLKTPLQLSPFRLPFNPGVHSFRNDLFDGLPGVFNDSLPDGWGRLLLDRTLRARGLSPEDLTPLDRLAHVGRFGMGALIYEPDRSEPISTSILDLDELASQTHDVLEGRVETVFETLLTLTGASAGARPKALIGVNSDKTNIIHGLHDLSPPYAYWIVKFASPQDDEESGAIEYVYSQMAKLAGVEMAETHLFPSTRGAGYFAIKRFDREENERLHMHTASGLLHTDFRIPALDYQDLIKATHLLTKDAREAEKIFRLASFNVLAHNRDDHGKNFSFLMDKTGEWRCAPAYDLTFSQGPGGQQSTMVMGEGKAPTSDHLLALGKSTGLSKRRIDEIIDQVRSALAKWPTLARAANISEKRAKLLHNFFQNGE